MLMTPGELKAAHTGSTDVAYHRPADDNEMSEMWQRKLGNSLRGRASGEHGSGVHEMLQKEQVRSPVHVLVGSYKDGSDAFVQHEGHHRIAASDDIAKATGQERYIPVSYDGYS